MEAQFPPRGHIVFPWLRENESAMMWAPTGIGKTMLSLSIALMAAGGGEMLGWRNTSPVKVLYVDGEMAIDSLQDRLVMLAETINGLDMEAAGANLSIYSRTDQHADAIFPDLAQNEGQAAAEKLIRHHQASLVVLDNFSTLADVGDENEASAMSPMLTFLMRLKQLRVATILVHHARKDGEDYRGSSKLAATFEVIFGLKPLDNRQSTDGAGFVIDWGKYRNRRDLSTTMFNATLEHDGERHFWERASAVGMQVADLVTAIRTGTYATSKELAEAIGVDPARLSRLKHQAIAEDRIGREEWDELLKIAKDNAVSRDVDRLEAAGALMF